jgi:hypothetical protein
MKSSPCTARSAVVFAMVLTVLSAGVGHAAAPPKMEKVIVKQQVEPYRALSSVVVYSLASDKDRVAVQFEDVFDSRLKRSDGPDSVKVGGVRYKPAMVLRARSRLLLLVDAKQQSLLRQLLNLPVRWPLSNEALRRDVVFTEGQKIAVRGVTVGTHNGKRCVLVRAVAAELPKPPAMLREVQLFWPGAEKVATLRKTGVREFPCHYVKDKRGQVEVKIQPMSRAALLADTALQLGRLEVAPGEPAAPRKYVPFDAFEVRAKAREEHALANPVYVNFADSMRNVTKVDKGLRSVSVIRHGKSARLEIGAALRTESDLTCLIPSESQMMAMQVERALAGEKMRIRGRILGTIGGARCVLVESLNFPDQERMSAYADVWLVTVTWPSQEPRRLQLWGFGQRDLTVPCLHARGRGEKLRVVLRQYREVEVERPVEPKDD